MEATDMQQQEEAAAATTAAIAAISTLAQEARDLKRDAGLVELPALAGLSPAMKFRIFANLDGARKAAEAAAKRVKELAEQMNEPVLAALAELELDRAPVTGGPTIYRSRELWAGTDPQEDEDTDAAYERACAGLEEAGLDDYVQTRFNSQSLSAYFREKEREREAEIRAEAGLGPDDPVAVDPEELLPAELVGRVKISEKIQAKAKTS